MSTPAVATGQSAQYEYLIETGLIEVDTTELLTDVENEWTAAFGS